VENHRP